MACSWGMLLSTRMLTHDNDTLANMPQCFVVMPYSEIFREYHLHIFAPAIQAAGLTPIVADDRFTTRGMVDQVTTGIRSSKIVLADLTGERPNVFYEMGLAHALGKPVIMLTQRAESIPSDLQHLRWIRYETISVNWAQKLQEHLTQALKDALVELDTGTERPSSLRPAEMDAVQSWGVGQRIVNLPGFQRTLLDYIRNESEGLSQEQIQAKVARSPGEVFYRLEQLRLLGLIIAEEIGRHASGVPKFHYRLSPSVKSFFETRL
jgi:nucleoside 2-deoxyribosyltransferase